ncbi:MAG: VWA domain-containing protein [Dinoroseobacter sp.]|nr:VWA domain-containing protein [Dinoroseobacter sp.]
MESLEYFHFLRPLWLLALPAIALLWYRIRPRREAADPDSIGIARHLADALRVGEGESRKLYPIDGVALAGALLAIAAAGPAWTRLPNPLVAETAPLVVALKVTESMETPDLAPSRLERARFKILDLIGTRAGARTGLVAYAGSAHQVAPLTEDPNILRPLLEGLTPQVMPVPGDDASAALEKALILTETAETQGAVLFVLDDLNPADVAAFSAPRDTPRPPVVFLITAPDSVALPQLDRIPDASVVRITPDDSDIEQIERSVRSAHAAALAADERLAWDDRGWMLLWPAALLTLVWFRQGWTMRWSVVWLMAAITTLPAPARAEGWVDWFLTPDQQGRLAYEDKKFSQAGELFEDPMWAGYAKYRAGEYEDAAAIFARIDTAEAAFAQGMAHIRSRGYRAGVAAFETALVRQPDFPEAERNLEVAQAIVEYVERAREQSDTGESGIGADEIVFDNESGRGAETQIEAPQQDAAPVTADQWLRSIDTEMGDFLRSRFLLENAGGAQ